MLHTAATKALKVLQQRTLAAFELLFPDLLDGSHQIAERAHERERAGVQRLDLAEQALEQRPEPGALRLIARKLLRQPRERVADRRQARGIQPSDLLAGRVEPGEQLLREPAGGRDVVGVAVAPPLGSTRGEARVMVAFDGAPGVKCPETLVEQLCVEAQRVALAQAICDLCRAQPQAEGLMLEIEDAHDAPVRLGLPGDREE